MRRRQLKILKELSSAHQPVTSDQLASLIEVSSRTIRKDIKALNDELEQSGAYIYALKGKGFELVVKDKRLFDQYVQELDPTFNQNLDLPDTPIERIKYLLNLILRNNEPIKLDDLSEQIHVSRSTLQADLKSIRPLLERYSLTVISRPNYGLILQGTELNRRFAISEYLYDHREIGPNLIQLKQVSAIAEMNETTLNDIWIILLYQIEVNKIVLSDIALNNLFVHIVIAYKRIKEGYSVNLIKQELADIQTQKEYEVAQKIIMQIQEVLGVSFPEIEIAYIAIHLLGTKLVNTSLTLDGSNDQVVNPEILQLVEDILKRIQKELSLQLTQDRELKISLALHLKPAINRYKYNMNIRNPMLEDIKSHYPLAFEAGITAATVINQTLSVEIDENEVAYIALHLGAAIERVKENLSLKKCYIVCASGIGSSKLIQYKLKSEFRSEIEVLGTTELYRLKEIPYPDIDFIISAVPINEPLPVPVLEVNAILSQVDLNNIKQFIKSDHSNPLTFIDEEHTFLNQSFRSKEEIFLFLMDQLKEKHALSEDYIEQLEKREEIVPTAYGNYVSIPHPITPQTSTTFLTFCTLKQPIQWGERKVQFVCLLNVEKDSLEDLQRLYDVLGKIVNTPSIVSKLLQCETYAEFIETIQINT
ncbi:BglG family transcription antiterminator [Marinilactibacillus sp. XAAS-LB27]|uniref:BglG family transcription antiterminator n=1 Tax=Marinilactibacillus sp. XAAS-LB27 TaxID=3114538 RepID=UPI002E172561|nr:BglG family transcription antiterminator [Marinilactibacillus sp. XAAS-LB27]